MTAFFALLPTLLQLLPSIISFVEQLHGSAPGQGPAKLTAAVDIVQRLVPAIAPHLTDDPAKLAIVNDIFGVGVRVMNATGMMPKAPVEEKSINA
jgi:hypothetical protein